VYPGLRGLTGFSGKHVRVMPMSYGTLLMVLALYKAAQYWKMSAGLKGFKLVNVLILDQLLYFLLYDFYISSVFKQSNIDVHRAISVDQILYL
jgi:hypothetical protein